MKSKILITILTLGVLLTTVKLIFAEKIDFNIFPTIIEIESEPEQTIKYPIRIKGTGGGEYTLKAYALQITDNQGHFVSSNQEVEYLDWISFKPETLTFENYEEKESNIFVEIPKDTQLGDYYLSIALERDFPDTQKGPLLSGAIEIPLLITVSKEGFPKLDADIKKFKTSYIDFFNPITFDIEIRNLGIRKLKSYGEVEIKNVLTNKTYTKELIPQNILAESTRIVVDEQGFVQGNEYVSWVTPDLVGIYSAKVNLYDKYHQEDNASILASTKELTFIYFDFFLLLGIVIAIILIILLVYNKKHESEYI